MDERLQSAHRIEARLAIPRQMGETILDLWIAAISIAHRVHPAVQKPDPGDLAQKAGFRTRSCRRAPKGKYISRIVSSDTVALARSQTTTWKLLSYRVIGLVFALKAIAYPSHIHISALGSGASQSQDDASDNSTPSQLGKPLITAENGGQVPSKLGSPER